MKLHFELIPHQGVASAVQVDISEFIVAGWVGRDRDATEHHIEELAALGVPRPSAVPLYYRVAANQLTQANTIQVIGTDSSGESEVLIFELNGCLIISLTSDHTDRKLEAHSVALSKQVCAKPVGCSAWRACDVEDHWDDLMLRSYIEDANGSSVLYQDGPLALLRTPWDLVAGYAPQATTLAKGSAMSCGTVSAIGGIRPSKRFMMELFDPVLNRTLRHAYHIESLEEIA